MLKLLILVLTTSALLGCVNSKIPATDMQLMTQLEASNRPYSIEGDIRPVMDMFGIDYNVDRLNNFDKSSTLKLDNVQDNEIQMTLTSEKETITKRFKGKLKDNSFKYGRGRIRGIPPILWAIINDSYILTNHSNNGLVIYHKEVSIVMLTIMPVFGAEHELQIKLR